MVPTFSDVLAAEARVRAAAIETPVLTHPALNAAAGAEVVLKLESLQTTGSFKIRGAMNRLAQLTETERDRGVVAFSSGNHAQGVARAARLFGVPALIVMPKDAPQVKVEGVLADGAEIRFYDRAKESREAIAGAEADARGGVLVPSFDDPAIIAGQGTAGLEFARQVSAPLDHLICCVGGGGLMAGFALAFGELSPGTRLWAAEPDGFDDTIRSLRAGRILAVQPGRSSICDAILTPRPGDLTFAINRERLAGGVAVADDDVRAAMRFAFRHLKLVVEPGGAAALAAAVRGLPDELRGGRVGVVVTGGNVDPGFYAETLTETSL